MIGFGDVTEALLSACAATFDCLGPFDSVLFERSVGGGPSAAAPRPAPFTMLVSSLPSSALRMGFVAQPSMPESNALARSSLSALAVSAMMGTALPSARMCRVAS